MRNTEARRYARWSLAAAAVLALIVVGVYLRNVYVARQAEKKAPPAVPPTVEQRSNEFSFSKVDGQRTIYTIRAARATQFKEGSRNLLEDVDISVYGRKGDRNDTLRTRACDFISTTGKISCAGEVQINLESAVKPRSSANAIQVATSALTFSRDSGEARTDNPVTFRWPAGRGSAVGVTYDSNTGTLRLEHNVDLILSSSSSLPPEESDPAADTTLHLTGDSMRFQRDTRRVQMNGDVDAQQSTRELMAGELLLELDGEFHAHRMVASDSPQLHDSGALGALVLSATEIASNLRPDGSVDSIVAAGTVRATRTTLLGDDAIDAGRIEIDLATRQNLPRLLTASNGVTLVSNSADSTGGTRRLETDGLEIHFSDNTHPGEIAMESVNTLAPARIEWRSATTVHGKSIPQTMQMKGKQMTLNFAAQNQLQSLTSTGGVEVARKVGDAPEQTTASRELNAKFDGGEWSTIDQTGEVHFRDGQRSGQSRRAHLDRAADTLTLEGSVAFADAATRTTAQSALFVHSTNTLRADGRVVTTELRELAGGASNFAQEPAHVSADHLVADAARGHAVYSGKGRLWQGESVIEAETIELDNPSHTLVARGHVLGIFPQAAWNPKPAQNSGGPPEAQGKQSAASSAARQPAAISRQLPGQTPTRPAARTPSRVGRPQTQLGRARGDLLTYWESESRGRIEQGAKVDTEQGSIQADRIDLFFSDAGAANATKELSRAVATGGVDVRQEDRRGTSEEAEYTASEGKFVLSGGEPTVYSSTGDTTTGRQLTFYFADDRIVVESAEGSKTVTLHQVEK